MTYEQLTAAFVARYGHKDTKAILDWWNDFCTTGHIPRWVTNYIHGLPNCMCRDCTASE